MASPAVTAAAIQGGFATVGGLFSLRQSKKNRRAQVEENSRNREHQYNVARMERGWSLADWEAQNAYNHPTQQMQRLREAGLNPNLVYGKGADTTAAMIRGSNASASDQNAPQDEMDYNIIGQGAQNAILTYNQVKMNQAQTDNIHQMTAVGKAEEALKIASTGATLQGTAKSEFELQQAMRTKDMAVRKLELENTSLEVHNQYKLDQNEREKLQNTANVQKTLMEITRIKLENSKIPLDREKLQGEINLLKQTEQVRKVEEDLAKEGIMKTDPFYYRWFMQRLNELGKGLKKEAEADAYNKMNKPLKKSQTKPYKK